MPDCTSCQRGFLITIPWARDLFVACMPEVAAFNVAVLGVEPAS